jgi:uncharacterized repeat protein (TIGR02543 family)
MFVNIGGFWRKTNDAFINIGGTWRKINSGFVNISGIWRKFYSSSNKPVPSINPTLTKVDGYQTIGYTLRGNTGKWTDFPTTFFWGFQYASTANAVNSAWTLIKVGTTQYYGQDSLENINHDLVIPRYIYNNATGNNDIDLVGKYIRFYTIADNVTYTSDTFSTAAIGPIYLAPIATTSPELIFSIGFSTTQVYVNAIWTAGGAVSSYQLQYNNAGTWTNLGAVQTTNPTQASPFTVLVPIGNYDYRVVAYSRDTGTPILNAISLTANYTFLQAPGAFNVSTFTKAYPGATTRSLSLTWSASSNATTYDLTIEGSNDNTIWTTVMSPATSSPIVLAPTTSATVTVSIYKYYRVIVRASNNGIRQFAYSNLNTAVEATGTAPGAPTINSTSVSGASLSISWAYSATKGSNTDNGVQWAVSSANNTPDSSLSWSSPRSSSSPITTTSLPTGTYYTYLRQWNSDELVSPSRVSSTSDYIPPAPGAFQFYLLNGGSVTTPSTPTQTRVSSTSNNILFEMGSAFPSDTSYYSLLSWGSGFSSTYTTEANAYSQNVTTLNQYNSSGNFVPTGGTYDNINTINSSATSSSPYNAKVRAVAKEKKIAIHASSYTGASSWKATFTISNAGAANGTYTDQIISSMPYVINFGTISTNPTITLTSLKAYSGTFGSGIETIGTSGTPTNLSVDYSTADSSISTSNYIYYSPPPAPVNITAPAITPTNGTAGTTQYSVTDGSWSNSPTSYSYQWKFNNGALGYAAISGATSSTFSPASNYVGLYGSDLLCTVTATNNGGNTPKDSNKVTVSLPQYTVTWNANGGTVSPASNTVNAGSSVTAPTPTRTGYTFSNWRNPLTGLDPIILSAGSTYTPTADITFYAIWTSNFVAPSSGAPALQFSRKTTATTHLQWYCDYPSISGDGSITGMQFSITTGAGGTGTVLVSAGSRAYPGAGTYPYSAGGTTWAFRMGTTDGDISYSSSARYGRARVVMLGTNGTTYYGTWSSWI